jgi:hypothetical protein
MREISLFLAITIVVELVNAPIGVKARAKAASAEISGEASYPE